MARNADDKPRRSRKHEGKLPNHPTTQLPNSPSSDEAEAFEQEMSDVIPLPRDPRGRVRAAPRVIPAPRLAPAPTRPRDNMAGDDHDAPDFVAPGVDRREIRKLKRGDHIPAERRDLHGMKAAEAASAVKHFLTTSRHKHHRCVCIVHGRGLHSPGSTPVLKTTVRALLRSDRAVLAYADAPASDGGAGAVYVLLRR